ncbi:hypothetical protein FPANT_9322 [Fusarium pseudoanthophilum]|uniref:Uncharacterized protein n=1 Tax=Fusarium pseudoanthophilum TaxID=48495 RepID=A0A8H5KVZ6_9HYPO|nr:hypothetical protein FPANT_9322 [Fusarium pseudoanthophilum]
MPLKIESNAESIAPDIYQKTLDIHRIGVDVCKNVPLREVIPVKIPELCDAITTDIFNSVGIQKHEAEECFSAMARKINNSGLLHHSSLELLEDVKFMLQSLSKVTRFQARTGKIVCPPAHVMGCVIAAIFYRKLRPTNEEFFLRCDRLVKVFGELNGIQWLSVAIQVFSKVNSGTFIVELDETCQKPVAEQQTVGTGPFWVVTTRMPQMNKYEDIFRNVLYPDGPAVQPSGPTVPKLEQQDNALPSVEPNDTTNEPIALSDDDESEDNTITLRDFTRQMKILGKRLATPDRAVARRARREILKKPGEVREQEVEDIGRPKEFFDSYSHFKDVWKNCLENGVSIPNSLRVLVDYHCTPSQVFHLTELEKEHQMEMEIDG